MSRTKYMSKPGRYGTLHYFAVSYDDPFDKAFGVEKWRCWAYDEEGAIEKFYDGHGSEDGFRALSVARVRAQ